MAFNTNGLFTVTPGPEYRYNKTLKVANKLMLYLLLAQDMHVNGLVDCHVHGFSVVW